jgi:hypothetical protein
MARPVIYATAQEAAEHNLYSKMGGATLGLTLEEFIKLVSHKCDLCGQGPIEELEIRRRDGKYILKYHFLQYDRHGKLQPLCRSCRALLSIHDLKGLLSHCARIMARRKWDVTNKWFFQALE